MALYPNQPFAFSDPWTPDLAYESFQVYFDDQTQYLGHRPRLLDSELSNDPAAIKSRVAALEASFKVSVQSGLTLVYTGGQVRLPDGSLLTVASGLVAVADNATSYVWLNDSGAVQAGLVAPVRRVMLSKIVTVSGAVSSIQDLRAPSIYTIQPVAASIKSFGGSNQTDKTCVAGETFNMGYYYYRNFTVPAGVTININKYARFFCSGNVDIAGTINVSSANYGAASMAATINRSNAVGGMRANGLGNRGEVTPWGAQPYGTGGSHGQMSSYNANPEAWGYTGDGGSGGGCLWIEAGGTINVSGSIFAKGSTASRGGADPSAPGAGSSAVANQQIYIGGAGGGSGGLVFLSSVYSVVIQASGVVDVSGGNGAQGCNFMPASAMTGGGSFGAIGGAGGGGGYFVAYAPSINTTGATLNVAGGLTGDIDAQGTYTGTAAGGGTWIFPNPYGIMGAGAGGGFGGTSGGYNLSISGSQQTFVRYNGGAGQVIIGNFIPIGS